MADELARTWLLPFTSATSGAADGDGRPWGDGTAMAARAAAGRNPWDTGCLVRPLIGGSATLDAIRTTFEAAIVEAGAMEKRGIPPGMRGRVYIADWLMNGLRDLSVDNAWGTNPWSSGMVAAKDQTALGLVLRMMSAGILVRIMLWQPTTLQAKTASKLHSLEHWSIAAAIQDHDASLQRVQKIGSPYGMVALDLRTAAPVAASLHQKMIVVRVGGANVGYCGGVDLAYTRRATEPTATSPNHFIGDWQSGELIPDTTQGWPKQKELRGGYPPYPSEAGLGRFQEDLAGAVYGRVSLQWFDQHLELHGPILATLEDQFRERWVIQARPFVFDRTSSIGTDNQVQFTNGVAFKGDVIDPLPSPDPVPEVKGGNAIVQMWRTIPLRADRTRGPFKRGEFTILSGIANAMAKATELITIWDQYFWSEPLARLLAARVRAQANLHVMVVVPPYGTNDPANELRFRKRALKTLWDALGDARARVAVYDTWMLVPKGPYPMTRGIYNHSKTQTYDDMLLVCGSANMNRRSFECDAELDCAVLDQPTTRGHLGALYQIVTANAWDDFAPGWGKRYFDAIALFVTNRMTMPVSQLIPDPFFPAPKSGDPKTPNNVPMPSNGSKPEWIFEPTSIAGSHENSTCKVKGIKGDPGAPGRLDEIAFLLERCHDGNDWPSRKPNSHWIPPGEVALLAMGPIGIAQLLARLSL